MFPEISSTIVSLIDVQQRLYSAIPSAEVCLPKQKLMLNAATELEVDVIITEQYPKGLGATIPELMDLCLPKWSILEKSSFSCFRSSDFRKTMKVKPVKSIALMGVESHVCVQQTAFDALNSGLDVYLLVDACASRNQCDMDIAVANMRQNGIIVTTVEAFIFGLLRDSAHPKFRTISKLIR
jgi:hypothetical protein